MRNFMSQKTNLVVYVLSDALGQATVTMARAALSKYPEIAYQLKEFTFLTKIDEIDRVMDELKLEERKTLVFHTFTHKETARYVNEEALKHCEDCYDILAPIIEEVGSMTGLKTRIDIDDAENKLDDVYFDRIRSLEFAVAHDDGKEPSGFLEADIVILGISRTSKTPLSIYLANNNYKVANLPLLPESELPEEIWEVNPKRIIGLTNDVEVLSAIRKERMISYGLNPETVYSNTNRIHEEIQYAYDIYGQLNCQIINVANRSIEETAAKIIMHLNEENLFHTPEKNNSELHE